MSVMCVAQNGKSSEDGDCPVSEAPGNAIKTTSCVDGLFFAVDVDCRTVVDEAVVVAAFVVVRRRHDILACHVDEPPFVAFFHKDDSVGKFRSGIIKARIDDPLAFLIDEAEFAAAPGSCEFAEIACPGKSRVCFELRLEQADCAEPLLKIPTHSRRPAG